MSDSLISQPPRHLGIILDGNRRWAKARDVGPLEGHKQGIKNFRDIVEASFAQGIEYVSAYIFSSENWSRSKTEVNSLMTLVNKAMRDYLDSLHKEGIRILVLGRSYGLRQSLLRTIRRSEQTTAANKKGTLAICFNYGGQQEIVDMTKKIVASGTSPEAITEELIEQNLYAPEIPPLDLLIRTSGEQRLSGFMLHRAAYAELYFSKKYWPDFTEQDLAIALQEYAQRQRRYGN